MNSLYDVQQLLKKFGTIIYTGDRFADLEMMEDEIRELYKNQLISNDLYLKAITIIRHNKNQIN